MRSTDSAAGASETRAWRRVLDKGWRLIAIACFALAVFWFGHTNSPLAPPAQATVYQTLGGGFAGVPSVWELQVDPGAVQSAELNGNRIYYTVEEDWRSVSEILDYYQDLYGGKPVDLRRDGVDYDKEAGCEGTEGVDWDAVMDQLNLDATQRSIRHGNDFWGVFGTVLLPDPTDPRFAEEMNGRAETFKETGKLADLGEAKFVYAMRPPGAPATTVMAGWPAHDFDIRSVQSDGERDAPGLDPPDVPRMGGDLRLLSFVQERPEMAVYMAQYQSRQSEGAVLDFYSTHLPQYDWAEDPRVEAVTASSTPSRLFVRGRQQCHVTVSEDPGSATTVASVVVTGPPGTLAP